MQRRIFNAIAVLSAVLCVATVALWVRSYSVADLFECRDRPDGGTTIGSGCGYLFKSVESGWRSTSTGRWVFQSKHPAYAASALHVNVVWSESSFLGIWEQHGSIYASDEPSRLVRAMHYGIPATATAIAPLAWVLLASRRLCFKRVVSGYCQRCGYDLRATPERCPECGMVPEKSA